MEQRFSPREFLKARRPERFADSIVEEGPTLDRPTLEYHLEYVTSRNQETEFQRFAFELAKRTVCPNLLPQTGPTGGGDSKVDTETYPVANGLSLVWAVGADRDAASERWGFAISANKDWKSKLRSDIAKIVATGRGYKKAFFITSQFVRDKERADLEDDLRKKHGLDVRILDRSWILDRVFDEHLASLAIDGLGLSSSLRPRIQQGPLDAERQRELEKLDERIKSATLAVNVIAKYASQVNLRTRFHKIIERAGLVPWERAFHNLRATRQTELEDGFPSHVVCAWMGNSESTARKHYLQVRDEHFDSAAKSGAVTRFTGCTERQPDSDTPQKHGELSICATGETGDCLRNEDKYTRQESNL